MFAYGAVGVVLVLHLAAVGFGTGRIGLLLTLAFLGDAVLSLALSTRADRWGRRRTLLLGAGLMVFGGALMAGTESFGILMIAATVGVISPTGNEVGPFLAAEQAGLAQVAGATERTRWFAWYHVAGYGATALGALAAGIGTEVLQAGGWSALGSYRAVLLGYAGIGVGLGAVGVGLSAEVEAPRRAGAPAERGSGKGMLGLPTSRGVVLRLAALFSLDALGGGFVVQSFLALWLQQRFGASPAEIGAVFFGTNVLAGASALAAVPLARRFGLINVMVGTHLPSNVLLMLVPLMPTFTSAAGMLLARHLLSQMDVPTRQSYLAAVVPAAERSAANGIAAAARQLGGALAPMLAGPLWATTALAGAPFLIGGGLKIIYDLALWRRFRQVLPPEERDPIASAGNPGPGRC